MKVRPITLDQITEYYTAFKTFQELINAPNYRPTIRCNEGSKNSYRRKELSKLADWYDYEQMKKGSDKRAFRG